MADNIKIVGNILSTQQVTRYETADTNLLASQTLQEDFGLTNDYIEYFVYDAGGNALNTNYTYRDFKSPTTSFVNPINNGLPIIEIDPVKDLQNLGYTSGEFRVQYNLFTNKISNPNAELFLKEISADRTELRVGSTILTNEQIESRSLELINEYSNSLYFVDYLLNFGDNNQIIIVNTALNKVESGYEILFKLYQPLPDNIQEKSTLWVVKEKSNPYAFDINLDKLITPAPGPKLRGPNFNIDVPNQNNIATSYQTYTGLVNSVQNVSTASYQQLLSLITSQSIDINVDYTNFTNFIFFGSAEQRVINFYGKVKQIEKYKTDIAKYALSSSVFPNMVVESNLATASINTIISQFDGYEQYLYFESGSAITSTTYGIAPYPKSTSTLPYVLATTASATSWYNLATGSAEYYDDNNQNNLVFTVPTFIKDDDNNSQYITFLNMVGHYFDNIWIFLQAVTDINLANNNLEKGVSKDLVYHVLESLGTKLYNQYGDSNNTNFLIGNSGSANFNENFTSGNIPSTLSISSASLSPFTSPTGSFNINGIIIAITGSTLPINTSTTIYIPTGSTFNNTLNNIVTSFNISSSFSSYSSSLQYITAQNSSSNLNFTTSFNLDGDLANSYYAISGSTILYFSGGTGSYLNTIPRKDLLAESYKRIYHNLPLLLKTKGTSYGLQTLVSTFGISSNDHYTILDTNGSESYWYTPTGSAMTSSILRVKEYGGDTKSGLLDEFNNDKIRIVTSSIVTGSVLSPFISLQQQPTSSTQFRTNDLNYVDISFSPQDKIDIFTSASIAKFVSSSNTTWSLDDFIGDPRFQYSGSYPTLETERTTYLTPLATSQIPFTSSVGNGAIGATNYNDFIRLIQFFDNSLFKMLKDYVPARTSLSTGITISSPILERNKWVLANPSSTSEIGVEDGTIEGPTIGSEYTDIYTGLTGSKAAYYDGVFTGSGVNVHDYFVSGNFNPYLLPTSSLNGGDLYRFSHTDFNVTLNNVSRSLVSSNRQDIEYIFGTTGSILSPSELQDSYNTLKTHQLSRYEGSKLSSLLYNTYTSASVDYVGDISFGKTAVIDRNVVKLGLFSEVVANKYLPNRNNASLKYLVDIDGNLTELNLRNTHWEEIQNTFVATNTGSISQFNNQLYSNQKTTDGQKIIFNSGYSYSPLVYFSSCSADPSISFQNISNPSAHYVAAQNLSSSYFISGSTTLGYPVKMGGGIGSTNAIINIFNYESDDTENIFNTGSLTFPPSYSVVETGQYKVSASINMDITMASGNSVTYSLEMYSGSTLIQSNTQQTFFGDLVQYCNEYTITNNSSDDWIYINYLDCVSGEPIRVGIKASGGGTPISRVVCSRDTPVAEWYAGIDYNLTITATSCSYYTVPGTLDQTLTFNIDRGYGNTNYVTATNGNTLKFQLKLNGVTTPNYTASLRSTDSLKIGSLSISTGYSSTSCPYIDSYGSSSITFDQELSSFYNKGYLFLPNPLNGTVNSLYGTYGDVDYQFTPKVNDVVLLYLSDNSILEYTVLSVNTSTSTGKLTLNLDSPLSNIAKSNLGTSAFKRFLLLSRIDDETNVILNFIKRDGKTSYGFLIPETISSTVLANIDTITKEVKQKLLNDQPIINDISGGSFGP